jgi:hypothetical protein
VAANLFSFAVNGMAEEQLDLEQVATEVLLLISIVRLVRVIKVIRRLIRVL